MNGFDRHRMMQTIDVFLQYTNANYGSPAVAQVAAGLPSVQQHSRYLSVDKSLIYFLQSKYKVALLLHCMSALYPNYFFQATTMRLVFEVIAADAVLGDGSFYPVCLPAPDRPIGVIQQHWELVNKTYRLTQYEKAVRFLNTG